ncbi:hypothetical protein FVE85_8841 [Porphyridium purpureum]|uniref:Integrase catalytic domain-containing protein n=1 Tax=Porphyridium purpureum TaxID=35688 RepID=A0A5J4YQ12_PORPP|nr:hypothetical protein FVE85_8841 [Porphyridium purpureum]|eukprot:POR0775..scf296_7
MNLIKNLFPIAVVKPFKYLIVTPIQNKSAEHWRTAVIKQLKMLRGHEVSVKQINSDRESGIKVVVEWMMGDGVIHGILPELTGAGEAVQPAERAIRLVKERVRSVIRGLPFVLPTMLVSVIVEYYVQRINGLRSSVSNGELSGRSPLEKMTWGALDARKDLSLAFGH